MALYCPKEPVPYGSVVWVGRRLGSGSGTVGERLRERLARVELELAEDAREMPFHRPRGDEQRLRDLAIRQSLTRDSAMRRSLAVSDSTPLRHDRARAGAGRAELGLGVLGDRSSARADALRRALRAAAPRASLRRLRRRSSAPRSVSARDALELGIAGRRTRRPPRAAAARPDRRRRPRPAALHATPRCARRAERPGELELLLRQPLRRLALAEQQLRERGLRAPWQVARTRDERPRRERRRRRGSRRAPRDAALRDAQPTAREPQDRCGERSDARPRRRAGRAPAPPLRARPGRRARSTSTPPLSTRYIGGAGSSAAARAVRASLSAALRSPSPEREPAAMREADCEPAAVTGRARLGDRGVEQRAHLGVALGPDQRDRGLREPRREREPRPPLGSGSCERGRRRARASRARRRPRPARS